MNRHEDQMIARIDAERRRTAKRTERAAQRQDSVRYVPTRDQQRAAANRLFNVEGA